MRWAMMLGLAAAAGASAERAIPPVPGMPDPAEVMKAYDALLKAAAPRFHSLRARLNDIERREAELAARLARGELGWDEAREEMLPLVVAGKKLRDSPEYLVEERLFEAYQASPQYREAVAKALRGLLPRGRAAAP